MEIDEGGLKLWNDEIWGINGEMGNFVRIGKGMKNFERIIKKEYGIEMKYGQMVEVVELREIELESGLWIT